MTILNPQLLPKLRSDPLLAAIRGMPCALRISSFIPGYRCSHVDTVVPCHVRTIGKGMGTKVADLFVVAGCEHCHSLLDGRDARWHYLTEKYPAAVLQRVIEGLCETQTRLWMAGIITVAGAVEIKGGGDVGGYSHARD